MGNWNATTRSFVRNATPINASRVTVSRTAARGNPISMMFASAVGFNKLDIKASAVAMLVSGVSVNQNIQATANPFLSGMPAGSVASRINPHNNPDYAGTTSSVSAARQSPDDRDHAHQRRRALTFDSIGGTAGHDPSLAVLPARRAADRHRPQQPHDLRLQLLRFDHVQRERHRRCDCPDQRPGRRLPRRQSARNLSRPRLPWTSRPMRAATSPPSSRSSSRSSSSATG